jgi:hypothetical protein
MTIFLTYTNIKPKSFSEYIRTIYIKQNTPSRLRTFVVALGVGLIGFTMIGLAMDNTIVNLATNLQLALILLLMNKH